MKWFSVLASILLAFSLCNPAQFSLSPYLYANEKNASVDYVSFQSANGSTAKIVKVGGEEALLLIDDKMVADKAAISSVVGEYYRSTFYPSAADLAELKGFADAFNSSRNYMTRYGPAEQTCWTGGTFLSHRSCSDLASCMQTASMVCSIAGGDGCIVDYLATHILAYKKTVDKLNAANAKFYTGYGTFSASVTPASLAQMEEAFNDMKTAGDEVMQSKLRFPEATTCMDCMGRCPEYHLDYAAITSGKAKIAALRAKTAPYANLQLTVDKIFLSTGERIKYREGEEKSVVFAPKYEAATAKYGGLKAQAVEAKAIMADSNFVSVADAYLNKQDELDLRFGKREFDGFDALITGYETSGRSLSAMINNSTAPYKAMLDSQDDANDRITQAMWRVNRLSPASIETYNSLASRKNALDDKVKPPMTSAQYAALEGDYQKLTSDARTYIASTATLQDSVFSVGNSFGRASVDGTVALVSSMAPLSFKDRQAMAKYAPPIVLGVIDLSILSVGLLLFVAVFYQFHGFFKNRLALSGWVLTGLAFVFVLLIGSAGFYGIVLSTERYTSFEDFYGSLRASDGRVAIIVDETGASDPGSLAMKDCANQVAMQLAAIGKDKVYKYYIDGAACTSMVPKNVTGNGTVNYSTTTGMSSQDCLNSMPDMPVIELMHSSTNEVPVFTTVVTKQAIFKGNDAYYAKKPMCDAANVLN